MEREITSARDLSRPPLDVTEHFFAISRRNFSREQFRDHFDKIQYPILDERNMDESLKAPAET